MKKSPITLSTGLTIGRLILVPIIATAIVYHYWALALALFIAAVISDILDGALARLFNERTTLGMYLDPIADKLLILGCFVALTFSNVPAYVAPLWFLMLLIVKDVFFLIGAAYLVMYKKIIAPTWFGKAAMALQSLLLFWTLLLLHADRIAAYDFQIPHTIVATIIIITCLHYFYLWLKETRLWYLLKRACSVLYP